MMRLMKGSACLVALALSLGACADEPLDDDGLVDDPLAEPMDEVDVADPDLMDEGGEMDDVSVADIVADPMAFDGRTVTVVADVEEVFGPMAFSLDEDAPLEGGIDEDLMVLSRQASGLEMIDDQWLDNQVRVTGIVRSFTVVELEREVGWDFDAGLETEVEGRQAVLVATALMRMPD